MTTTAENPYATASGDDAVLQVLNPDGSLDPKHDPRLEPAEVLALYRHMVTTRIVDERLVALQRQGRIGFHIGSLGEEASIIGSAYAMRPQDWIFPCYREFGAALLRGMPLQRYLDNMFGNRNDPAKGRQMPDHYTYRAANWGSVSSPIGTQMSQATGFAWAAKLRKEELAALVYFGEGSTSSNEFHVAMNFAGVFKTPVVFFCRNNGWAISVPVERQTASRTFAEKGVGYGVPALRVDGNDIFAVIAATRRAVAHAAAGKGATLIESLSYRMGGHSTSDDPNAYRSKDALEPWFGRDPIARLRQHLALSGAWDDAREEALRSEIEQRFRDAAEAAERTPPPPLESMFEDVYESLPWHLAEQRTELLTGPRAPSSHH